MSDATLTDRARRVIAGLRGWSARRERFLWAGLIVVVVVIQWRTDLASALLEAQRTDKAVLVDFNADWCPPCIVMKHDVWPDDAVEDAVTRSYIPVLIDVDNDTTVGERYGVRGIPTVLVLDAAGHVVRRGGFLNASGMVKFLTRAR